MFYEDLLRVAPQSIGTQKSDKDELVKSRGSVVKSDAELTMITKFYGAKKIFGDVNVFIM